MLKNLKYYRKISFDKYVLSNRASTIVDNSHGRYSDLIVTDKAPRHKINIRHQTIVELERLQGFPDEYTAVMFNNKFPHTLRQKVLGNAMAVNCLEWLLHNLKRVDCDTHGSIEK